jgi:hypothetical protein
MAIQLDHLIVPSHMDRRHILFARGERSAADPSDGSCSDG